MKEKYAELLRLADEARKNAYAPYSTFSVGAALLTADGRVYTGVNIENASFGATVCAERVALFSAVAEGVREFAAIAIVGGKAGEARAACYPCGICRQVLAEFCSPDMPVILEGKVCTLGELLPNSFGL